MSKLSDIEKAVSKQVGGGDQFSVHRQPAKLEGLSTGLLTVNHALSGTPSIGFAFGRIAELFGPEMSGKTTLAFTIIRQAQESGLISAFIDMEHAMDKSYARSLGVDVNNLSIAQPDFGESAISMAEAMLEHGYRLIVIDSVAALIPKSELDGDAGDAHMGRQARLMAQAVRKLTPRASKARAIVIFINQLRANLSPFGASETTSGGNALKYFASYRVDIRSNRSGKITQGGQESGIHSKIKIVKNKLFPPQRQALARIHYGEGFDLTYDLLEYLFRKGTTKLKVGSTSYTKKGLALKLSRNVELRDRMIAKLVGK